MSAPEHGSADWIKAEQAKVSSGKGEAAGASLGRWMAIGCGIPIAIVAVLVLATALWPKDSGPRPGDAIGACEDAISELLKAPDTARFSSSVSGNNPFIVVGEVDAQNSFGAEVRSQYQCTVNGTRAVIDYLE